jgi:hypothetical protein
VTAARIFLAKQQLQERGFAGAAGARKENKLALIDGKGDIDKRRCIWRISFADLMELDH